MADMEKFHNGKSSIKTKENSLKDYAMKLKKTRRYLCNDLTAVENKAMSSRTSYGPTRQHGQG